jgi:hypothetical protein
MIGDAVLRSHGRNMKGYLFAIILILFGGVFLTANAQATGRGATSVLFDVKQGHTERVPASRLKIKFLNVVEDSRCPRGTQCIWAGNAKVKLRVSDKRRARVFDLNTAKGNQTYSFEGYQIRLVKVAPTPVVNEHIRRGEYVVTLTAIPPGPTGRG